MDLKHSKFVESSNYRVLNSDSVALFGNTMSSVCSDRPFPYFKGLSNLLIICRLSASFKKQFISNSIQILPSFRTLRLSLELLQGIFVYSAPIQSSQSRDIDFSVMNTRGLRQWLSGDF